MATFQDGSTITYTFDAGIRLTKAVDSLSGILNLTYDDLDRLTQEGGPNGTVNYTYDNEDRRASMTVAGQTQVTYTYDIADRLTNVTQGSSAVTIGYDAADRRISLTLPNGVVTQYGYDSSSQLTSLTYKLGGTTLGDLSYGYDGAGQRSSVGGAFARVSLPSVLASATYNSANRLTQWGSTNLAYDANGSMTSDGTNSFTWDVRNRLISMTGATFQYDPFGRRSNRSGAKFLYDSVNRVQELSGSTVTANLLPGLAVDETFTRTDSGGTRDLLADAPGSTVALTDTSGTLQTQYTYEPFGKTTTSGASNANPLEYTGRENEANGLYYYRARYYNVTLQRFISEDPLGFGGQDVNLYGYVWNSPTNFVDPVGELGFGVSVGGSAEGGAGYAGAGATGSVGGGFFFNGWHLPSLGGFASGGAFAGGPPASKNVPGWGPSAPSCPNDNNWAAGLFAGAGVSGFLTNANDVSDLAGPFKTWSFNAGWGARVFSIQFSHGQNAAGQTIYYGSYGGLPFPGVGYGLSASSYNTNTVTTSGRGCGCH